MGKIGPDDNGHICSSQGMVDIIKNLGEDILGIEIGISSGRNAAYILQECQNIQLLVGIDPYLPFQDWDIYVSEELQKDIYQMMIEYLGEEYSKHRFTLLKDKSEDVFNKIEDNEYSYVFVDGDHSYDATYKDCLLYYSKVKTGGIFSGHDWQLHSVQKAVYDFRKLFKIDNQIQFAHNNCWYWYK